MKHWRGMLVLLLTVTGLPAQNVLTWNVGLLSVAGVDIVPNVTDRARQIPGTLARLANEADLDVIALQEVWNDTDARAILAALEPLGYRGYRPLERAWTGVGSGLLVLWSPRWTPRDQVFVPWATTAGWEGLSRKGLAHVALADGSGQTLDVLSFHFGAVDAPKGVVTDGRQRAAWSSQLEQLRSRWSEVGATSPAVVLGDVNVGPGYGQEQFDLLKGLPGLVEAGEGLVTWDPENPLVKGGAFPKEPPAWIDHVFSRSWVVANTTAQALDLGLSDHYAVLVTDSPQR